MAHASPAAAAVEQRQPTCSLPDLSDLGDLPVVDRYTVSLLLEHPTAVGIQAALDEHRLHVAYSPKVNSISAVGALESLFLWGVLRDTLQLISAAWRPSAEAHRAPVLLAVGTFHLLYRNHPSYVVKDFAAILSGLDPLQLLVDAARGVVNRNAYSGRSTWAPCAALLREEYNAGLPATAALPRYEQPEPADGHQLSWLPRS